MTIVDHATPPRPAFTWRQPLPRSRPVLRDEALAALCKGRRVAHVGFVDDRLLEERLAGGSWLHARLSEAASSIVGIDCSTSGVEWARQNGFEAYFADGQSVEDIAELGIDPAEVVIAGEVIEHLDAPGPFLRAMHALCCTDGLLVVTTPNAYRPVNVLAALFGFEFIHPDHTAWHSPHTLRQLHERSGWVVESISYYQNPPDSVGGRRSARRRLAGFGADVLRGFASRFVPPWCDGLIVCSTPAHEGGDIS